MQLTRLHGLCTHRAASNTTYIFYLRTRLREGYIRDAKYFATLAEIASGAQGVESIAMRAMYIGHAVTTSVARA